MWDLCNYHLRLPSVVPRPSVMSRGKSPSQFRHSVAPGQIALTSRRSSKTHLVPFDKGTAAMYLRQTEQLWLMPNLSRQEGEALSLSLSLPLSLSSLYTCVCLYLHCLFLCLCIIFYTILLIVLRIICHTHDNAVFC